MFMLILAVIVVWVVGSIIMEFNVWRMKKVGRSRHNTRRQYGMIPYTNKQYTWMRWLWPVVIVCGILGGIAYCFIMLFAFIISCIIKIRGWFKHGN